MHYHNKQQFITWLTFYWAGTELNTHNYGQFTDDELCPVLSKWKLWALAGTSDMYQQSGDIVHLFFIKSPFSALTLGLATGRSSSLSKAVCWFAGGDILTGVFLQVYSSSWHLHFHYPPFKIQNADILVLANPGPPGKMAIIMDRLFVCLLGV